MKNMNHREDCGICHGIGHTSSQCPKRIELNKVPFSDKIDLIESVTIKEELDLEDVLSRRNTWMNRTATFEEQAENGVYAKDSSCYIAIKDVPVLVEEIKRLRQLLKSKE